MTDKKMGFTHDNKDNMSVDWYTPPWIFEKMGLTFDLDPCCPQGGVPWIPAQCHYSLPLDGLSLPWFGKVWLNPPYGKETPIWLAKMHQHRCGVSIVFSRTDTRWFHEVAKFADAMLFMKGRVSFVDGLGKTAGQGAGAGSLMLAWGDECVAALSHLAEHGYFIKKEQNNANT